MIAIIDYGAGNLRSVVNAFEAIGYSPTVTNNPADLKESSAIVLPGVGAFGDGMNIIHEMNLVEALNEQVLAKQKPFLGICLGMEFLACESHELGNHAGLGWVDGIVERIAPNDEATYRIPHIGWNNLDIVRSSTLFEGLEDPPAFYFLHSYQLVVADSCAEVIKSTCWHGTTITASIERDNIFAVQFHPEKSQRAGLKLLENFARLA